MSPYECDCTNVVYMFCVYCLNNYVNKFEARSLFSTSHLKKFAMYIYTDAYSDCVVTDGKCIAVLTWLCVIKTHIVVYLVAL